MDGRAAYPSGSLRRMMTPVEAVVGVVAVVDMGEAKANGLTGVRKRKQDTQGQELSC